MTNDQNINPPIFAGKNLRNLPMNKHLRKMIVDACLEFRHQEVAELCEKAIESEGKFAELYFHAGKHRLLQKPPLAEQAEALLLEAVQIEPTFAAAYRLLGDACITMTRYNCACKYLEKATGLDPTDNVAWTLLALANAVLRRNEEAIRALGMAIRHTRRHIPSDLLQRLAGDLIPPPDGKIEL